MYSIGPIKRTVFLCTVTVLKNTVCVIGTIEYTPKELTIREDSGSERPSNNHTNV